MCRWIRHLEERKQVPGTVRNSEMLPRCSMMGSYALFSVGKFSLVPDPLNFSGLRCSTLTRNPDNNAMLRNYPRLFIEHQSSAIHDMVAWTTA